MRKPTHDERIRSEIETFKGQVNIHDLPDIFHYWSNKFLGPYLAETFGTPNHYQIFAAELIASLKATVSPKIVSVGAGDGSVEIEVAKIMRAEGAEDFRFECLELSPHLIQRGLQAAHEAGVSKHVTFEQIDLNTWKPTRQFGAAFAHHSL
ncbi:MAG: class I SAM-dependent methyltransferase, partial [Alphaproteobacteria bacterium]